MRRLIVLLFAVTLPGLALAQAPAPPPGEPETIYSDAQREKDDATARHFVQGYLESEPLLDGEFARWKQKVCPKVWGLKPVAAWMIEHRIKQIAAQVGAPVDMDDPCATPNLLVVVTQQPQASLDSIAEKAPVLVAMQEIKRLKIKYPVQSWYISLVKDDNGRVMAYVESPDGTPPQVHARLSRLYTGVTAEMGIATVIIDANAVNGLALGTIADYAALVGLSQTVQRGVCQPVPTVANLLLKGCSPESQSAGLSDVDLAMLTGLYHSPESPEQLQRQFIVKAMKEALARGQDSAPP